MATGNQQFLPPFYQNNLVVPMSTTTLLISYVVTPQESFRCGKYATGSFKPGEFRPATVYPENT